MLLLLEDGPRLLLLAVGPRLLLLETGPVLSECREFKWRAKQLFRKVGDSVWSILNKKLRKASYRCITQPSMLYDT